jgi:hypothetical protein
MRCCIGEEKMKKIGEDEWMKIGDEKITPYYHFLVVSG